MKKIIISSVFLLIGYLCFSQPLSLRSNGINTVNDRRLEAEYNLFAPRYSDTTAANILRGIDSCGAMIYTYDYGFWYRECISGSKRWSKFASGTISTSYWGLTGNASTIAGTNFIGTTDAVDLWIKRAGIAQVKFKSAETEFTNNIFVTGGATISQALGVGTSTPDSLITNELGLWSKRGVRFSGIPTSVTTGDYLLNVTSTGIVSRINPSTIVTATPTWQQTLTAGSTLTGNNTIQTGGFNYKQYNVKGYELETRGDGNYMYWHAYGTNKGSQVDQDTTRWLSTVTGGSGGSFNSYINQTYNEIELEVTGAGTIEANATTVLLNPTSGGTVGIANSSPSALLTLGTAGSVKGTVSVAGNTSGTITIQPQAAAGTYNFNLPTTAGTSGQVLTSAAGGSSAMTWTTPSTTIPISSLTAATGTNTINNANYEQLWQWNTLADNVGLTMISNSTTAANNSQNVLSIGMSGANANASQTTTVLNISNIHSGTASTNVGLYVSASGGTVNNALNIAAGALTLNGSAGTTGQVLTSAGANTLPTWTTPTTGTVTSVSGTANQIGVATGTTTPVISLVSGGTLPGAWVLGTPASGTVTNLTGTASININGTVGATTPTTGAFTTVVASTSLSVTGNTSTFRAASGATNLLIQEGATQSTTDLQTFKNAAGTVVSGFTSLGHLYVNSTAPAFASDIAGFFGGLTRMTPAGNSEKSDDLCFVATDAGVNYSMIFGINSTRANLWTNFTKDIAMGANGDLNQFVLKSGSSIGMGTSSPAASSVLDITSTTKGLLIPRQTTTERNAISSPATLLQIANTSTNTIDYYSGAVWRKIDASMIDFIATVDNGTTVETDLLTYTTPASTLAASGEKLMAKYAGTFNDLTATSQVQVYFAGTNIGNTGALTVSATGGWTVEVMIIRTGASTARAVVNINTPGASTAIYTSQTDLTGLTFTNTNIIKITGTAGGASGGTGDISAKLGTVSWMGAAN